jgi:hypothetical protein
MSEERELRAALEETQRRLRDAEALVAELKAVQARMAAVEAALTLTRNGSAPPPSTTCLQCGTPDIMTELEVVSVGGEGAGSICARTLRDPKAVFRKEPFDAPLVSSVCGRCGHVELKTRWAGKLREAFDEGRQRGTT